MRIGTKSTGTVSMSKLGVFPKFTAKLGAVAAGLTLLTGASTAAQAQECPKADILPAFELTALQTEFMVAALNCDLSADYNKFVEAYREKLVASDRRVGGFFKSVHGAKGPRSHDTYKTKLANEAFLRSMPDFAGFCRNSQIAMRDMVDNPVKEQATFVTLVSAQPGAHHHNMAHCVRGQGGGSEAVTLEAAPKK